MDFDLDDQGVLSSAATTPLLDVAAAAHERGRYLPVDAQHESTTAAEAALYAGPAPRVLGYGPALRWLAGLRHADGRLLDLETDNSFTALAPADLTEVQWRTLPLPEGERTVLGLFLDSGGAAEALARLTSASERASGLVAAELCDRGAGHWLIGEVLDAECVLVLRFEGAMERVALGSRAAWQAVELARGLPRIFEREWGPWRWRAVHPDLGDRAAIVRFAAEPPDVPALFDDVIETAALLGESAARAHAALGALYGYLPHGPRLPEAIQWLRSQAHARQATLDELQP